MKIREMGMYWGRNQNELKAIKKKLDLTAKQWARVDAKILDYTPENRAWLADITSPELQAVRREKSRAYKESPIHGETFSLPGDPRTDVEWLLATMKYYEEKMFLAMDIFNVAYESGYALLPD
jgi:hypothetical protein